MSKIEKYLPAITWLKNYSVSHFQTDLTASIIATILLIPQSMGYAMLAGLPAVTGLYASILPSIAYALFGSSRTLAVGPVAVTSMMTATIALPFALSGSSEYTMIAILLALLSGIFLFLMSLLKMGFLASLLSHPVISGFISASAILIAVSQLKHLLAIQADGSNLISFIKDLSQNIHHTNLPTLILGVCTVLALILLKRYFARLLTTLKIPAKIADILGRSGPVIVVLTSSSIVAFWSLDQVGIPIVGHIDTRFPQLDFSYINWHILHSLLPGAFLISIVGFVGSVSVAQSFAAKRKETISPNQELCGLGVANIAAAFSASFPVTGGFSRSAVNLSAGAESPMTGILTALFMLIILLFFTPLFFYLPTAVLASCIIVAILQLVDFHNIVQLYKFSKQETLALLVTFFVVLFIGMEAGIIAGVSLSLLFFLWHTSHPHIAVVGRIPGTEQFRNVKRFDVETDSSIVTLRIDENLFFANAKVLENYVLRFIAKHQEVEHLVLMFTAVNMIDASALDSLEAISERLQSAGVTLHLSEVKGPVMDKLANSLLLEKLNGKVFLTQHQAMETLIKKQENRSHPTS